MQFPNFIKSKYIERSVYKLICHSSKLTQTIKVRTKGRRLAIPYLTCILNQVLLAIFWYYGDLSLIARQIWCRFLNLSWLYLSLQKIRNWSWWYIPTFYLVVPPIATVVLPLISFFVAIWCSLASFLWFLNKLIIRLIQIQNIW